MGCGHEPALKNIIQPDENLTFFIGNVHMMTMPDFFEQVYKRITVQKIGLP
jgi:hypothetical protein